MATARLVVEFESKGYADNIAKLQQLKSLGLEVQAALSTASKRTAQDVGRGQVDAWLRFQRQLEAAQQRITRQQDAHVAAYRRHQQQLTNAQTAITRQQDAHVAAYYRNQRQLELAQKRIEGQQDAHVAAYRKYQQQMEQAQAKALAKQEAEAAKQAAREKQQALSALSKQNATYAKQADVASSSAVATGGLNTGMVNLAATLSVARQVYAVFEQIVGVMANITNEAAKWEKFERALTDIEGSSEVAKQSLDELYELAKRPGIGLQQANQIYLQFRALGIEGERAKRMIVDFSNTVALSGGGATEFERINYQLVQMISKGKILEEDLRIMRNSMPRLTLLMRDAFGATTAKDLRDRGIDAEQFVEGILTQMEKLPQATQTLESRIENAHTAWSRFKASLVDTELAGKGIDKLTGALEGMTTILNGKAWKEFMDTIAFFRDIDSASLQQKKRGEKEYGFDTFAIKGGSYDQMGQSYAAHRAKEDAVATKKQETDKEKKAREKREREEMERLAERLQAEADTYNAQHKLRREAAIEERKFRYDQLRAKPADKDIVQSQGYNPDDMGYSITLSDSFEYNGTSTGTLQKKLVAQRKKDLDEARKVLDDYAAKQALARKKALQELSEAERGEYANRLAEILAWEQEITRNMQATEDERTRIVAVANRKRTETYLEAYSNIASNTSGFFGSMASMSQQFDAENTRRYAAFVAVQQGLAIASATLNISVAMSRALQSGFTTLDGLVQMGIVAAEGGKILSAITSMNAAKVGKGAFDKGGSLGYGEYGIAGEYGPEIVSGPARITSRRETAQMLGASSGGRGTTVVNINDYAGVKADVKQNDDGSIDILLNKLEDRLASGVYSGSGKIGSAVERTYGLNRRGR